MPQAVSRGDNGEQRDTDNAGTQLQVAVRDDAPIVTPAPQSDSAPIASKAARRSQKSRDTQTLIVERYARTKEQRQQAKGKKPGHPGRFRGPMLEFLKSKVGDYQALPSTNDLGRIAKLDEFWQSVINDRFWVQFDLDSVRTATPGGSAMSDDQVIADTNSVSTLCQHAN